MSEHTQSFVQHLVVLAKRDRGAMAALRRSLGFAPGSYPPSFPIVERFVARGSPSSPYRLALYLGAGLFALNPRHQPGQPIGRALARQLIDRYPDRRGQVTSLEQRFIALLSADADALPTHLRHAVQLLAADERALDIVSLISDLAGWLDERDADRRDRIRQHWAIDFYRTLSHEAAPSDDEAGAATPHTATA